MNAVSVCTKCKKSKPIDQFNLKGDGSLQKQCGLCNAKGLAANTKRDFKTYIKNYDSKNWSKRMVINCRKMDSLKGREFDLDEKWIENQCLVQLNKCTHCHTELSFDMVSGNKKKPSVDRIDNTIGHLKSNCLISCITCNLLRGDMEADKFKDKLDAKKRENDFIQSLYDEL